MGRAHAGHRVHDGRSLSVCIASTIIIIIVVVVVATEPGGGASRGYIVSHRRGHIAGWRRLVVVGRWGGGTGGIFCRGRVVSVMSVMCSGRRRRWRRRSCAARDRRQLRVSALACHRTARLAAAHHRLDARRCHIWRQRRCGRRRSSRRRCSGRNIMDRCRRLGGCVRLSGNARLSRYRWHHGCSRGCSRGRGSIRGCLPPDRRATRHRLDLGCRRILRHPGWHRRGRWHRRWRGYGRLHDWLRDRRDSLDHRCSSNNSRCCRRRGGGRSGRGSTTNCRAARKRLDLGGRLVWRQARHYYCCARRGGGCRRHRCRFRSGRRCRCRRHRR